MAVNPDQLIPLSILGIGVYLAWFGVHYWASDTKWPSDPVKAVLTGKGIPVPTGRETAAQIASQVEANSTSSSSSTGVAGSGETLNTPTASSSIATDALKY